jgi:hypothetical protein
VIEMTDEKIISFDQFLDRFLNYGYHHQLGGSYIGIDEEHLFKFKELTSKIDFNCQFENGLCIRERKGRGIYESVRGPNPQCCCEHCASCIGHLEYISSVKIAKEIYELYDKDVGFWSENGCKLPRKWRSITCLTYSCGVPRKSFKSYKDLWEILHEGLIGIDNYVFKYIGKEGETQIIQYTDYRHPDKIFEMTTLKNTRGMQGSACKSDDVYKHLLKRITTSYSNHMRGKL